MSIWKCAAIDHGVTIFPNGKIGPCCLIAADYLKPIELIADPNRFADLKTPEDSPPDACRDCVQAESHGDRSYRTMFESFKTDAPGLQFIDIRNSNLCNLKCRTCGPHFSNKWGEEFGYDVTIKRQDITEYLPLLLGDSVHWMYFTGGEPLINRDHWDLLEELIASGRSKNIQLLYNTNMTTLKFKDKDITAIWKQFKKVTINCSIDAAGKQINYIRSDSDWDTIKQNFDKLYEFSRQWHEFNMVLSPTMSILNIWFFADLIKFAHEHQLTCHPIILQGPHTFALSVIPDSLTDLALAQLDQAESYKVVDHVVMSRMRKMIIDNDPSYLFDRTIKDILLIDNNRNERLFDMLPFKQHALSTINKFDEYK